MAFPTPYDPKTGQWMIPGWSAKPSGGGRYETPEVPEMPFTPAPAPPPRPAPAPPPRPTPAPAPAPAPAPRPAPAAQPAQNLVKPFDPYQYRDKSDPGTTDYFPSGPGYMDRFLAEEAKREQRQRIRDAAEGDGKQSVADKRLDDLFKPKEDAPPATEVTAQVEENQGGGLRDRIKQEMFSDPLEKDRKRKAGSGQFLDALMSTTTY
jgi:hypothetical protein